MLLLGRNKKILPSDRAAENSNDGSKLVPSKLVQNNQGDDIYHCRRCRISGHLCERFRRQLLAVGARNDGAHRVV